MAHADQLSYVALVKESVPDFFTGTKVLEVGSLDINGSVRQFFKSCDYTGVDVGAGPGVDLVVKGEDFDAPANTFDVVISCECMEHNPGWAATALNMLRVLRPGGLFVMSCALPGREEHGTTRSSPGASPLTVERGHDYYRNLSRSDFQRVPEFLDGFGAWDDWANWAAYDYYLLGVKGSSIPAGYSSAVQSITTWIDERNSGVGWGRAKDVALRTGGSRAVEALHAALSMAVHVKRLAGR